MTFRLYVKVFSETLKLFLLVEVRARLRHEERITAELMLKMKIYKQQERIM